MGDLIFERGCVLCYRLFDIADEIDLPKASAKLSQGSRWTRLSREGSQYLQLPNPPLAVGLGTQRLRTRAGTVDVESWARLFAHGAASIILRVPIPEGTSLRACTDLADELYDSAEVERVARELVLGLPPRLGDALESPHLWEQSESYSVVFAEKLRGEPKADEVLKNQDLVRLLLGEVGERPLSASEVDDALQHHFSYTDQDLVVIDWNAAFVYEPSGSMDIPDILEIANAQLLELRYYDAQLDGHLLSAHQKMRGGERSALALFHSPYRKLARQVLLTLIELSEFIERVENSLKIIGDFYLAKVYEAAVTQLRIPQWQATVTRKQQLLASTYQLLKGEVDTDRALSVEVAIVVLIVSEILLALGAVLPP